MVVLNSPPLCVKSMQMQQNLINEPENGVTYYCSIIPLTLQNTLATNEVVGGQNNLIVNTEYV